MIYRKKCGRFRLNFSRIKDSFGVVAQNFNHPMVILTKVEFLGCFGQKNMYFCSRI